MPAKMRSFDGWPEPMVAFLRGLRTSYYIAFDPGFVYRRYIRGGLPPTRLQARVGEVADFERSGSEFVAYLKLLCGLKEDSKVLDVGCGYGCVALPLRGMLSQGQYVGVDTDRGAIKWCRKHVGDSGFHFQHSFNPTTIGLPSNSFDIVLVKSVFTHLLQAELESYLIDISRILRFGGCCLATFFISDFETEKASWKFRYRNGAMAYTRGARPRLAVAYGLDYLKVFMTKLGFSFDIKPGTWSGNGGGLSFQDIVVMRRRYA